MGNSIVKRIELAANIAIIVVAVLLSTILVKSYLLSDHAGLRDTTRTSQVHPGTKINLPGVDWAKGHHTLLLAISTTCHFCTESAPFYQRLEQKRASVQLIAVLPQTPTEGQNYLTGLGVSVDEIKQEPLTSLDVQGTPTLILVDNKGIVTNVWTGELTADEEVKVLSQL